MKQSSNLSYPKKSQFQHLTKEQRKPKISTLMYDIYMSSFLFLTVEKCYFITNLITFNLVLNIYEERFSANVGKNTKKKKFARASPPGITNKCQTKSYSDLLFLRKKKRYFNGCIYFHFPVFQRRDLNARPSPTWKSFKLAIRLL